MMEIKIEPRKATDRGGVILMPLQKNIPQGRTEWELTTCPQCGEKCWSDPLTEMLVKYRGCSALCTMCALKYGSGGGQ